MPDAPRDPRDPRDPDHRPDDDDIGLPVSMVYVLVLGLLCILAAFLLDPTAVEELQEWMR